MELEIKRNPEIIAAEIRALTATMLRNVIEIGRRMAEAKELLPHGEFGKWIEENTGYSQRTANNFMRLFEEYGEEQQSLFGAVAKSKTIANLPYTKALALLSMPESEREAFAEEIHADKMSVKELREAIRAREDAERRAEEAELTAAEERKRAEGWEQKAEAYSVQIEGANAALERAKADLHELEGRKPEIVIEQVVDEDAVTRAVEEARRDETEKLNKQIKKSDEERRRAEESRKNAERKLEEARKAAQEREAVAEKERQLLQNQIESMRKQAEIASSAEISVFKMWFEQAQNAIDKMREIIQKTRTTENTEVTQKLENALRALCQKGCEP